MIKPYSDDDYFIVVMINLFSTLKLTNKPLVFGLFHLFPSLSLIFLSNAINITNNSSDLLAYSHLDKHPNLNCEECDLTCCMMTFHFSFCSCK